MIVDGVPFLELEDGKWEALESFEYADTIIPKGFVTDFRTTPKWAENIVAKFIPKYLLNFVWHDYMYRLQEKPRLVIDVEQGIYLKTIEGLKSWQCDLVYLFVRLFGGIYWKKHGNKSKTVG